jgi:hypothetical protein
MDDFQPYEVQPIEMAVLGFRQFASVRTDLGANQLRCLIAIIEAIKAQNDRLSMPLPFGNFDGLPVAVTAK